MDGELLLVVLSSVAQQEVENISDNVKKGLKMKMQRGELVGFQGCYGYDYDPETKSISVNREEAEYVRYIFDRYLEGAGSTLIAHELNEKGILTRKGMGWVHTSVMGILRNEKYKGDLRMGKTYTEDPIAKTRRINYGLNKCTGPGQTKVGGGYLAGSHIFYGAAGIWCILPESDVGAGGIFNIVNIYAFTAVLNKKFFCLDTFYTDSALKGVALFGKF